jgi:hypothetical protein
VRHGSSDAINNNYKKKDGGARLEEVWHNWIEGFGD